MKNILLVLLLTGLTATVFAQSGKDTKRTLSKEETKDILNLLPIDSAKILLENAEQACHCIDSVRQVMLIGEDSASKAAVRNCINQQVTSYQLTLQLMKALKNPGSNEVVINTNEKSQGYQDAYRDLEQCLMDSCPAIRAVVGSNDELRSEFDVSKNPKAREYYSKGISFFKNDDYAGALPYFKKAVELDSTFVFALDNLAVCYRKTGDLDNALLYYNKSLAIFDKGKTPIQNMPVIFEMRKEYDKAVEGYQKMIQIFPDDPEGFYGCGRIQIRFQNKLKEGLDNMCKAFNLYTQQQSPFRQDAITEISFVYYTMKEKGQEEDFKKILTDNGIKF